MRTFWVRWNRSTLPSYQLRKYANAILDVATGSKKRVAFKKRGFGGCSYIALEVSRTKPRGEGGSYDTYKGIAVDDLRRWLTERAYYGRFKERTFEAQGTTDGARLQR